MHSNLSLKFFIRNFFQVSSWPKYRWTKIGQERFLNRCRAPSCPLFIVYFIVIIRKSDLLAVQLFSHSIYSKGHSRRADMRSLSGFVSSIYRTQHRLSFSFWGLIWVILHSWGKGKWLPCTRALQLISHFHAHLLILSVADFVVVHPFEHLYWRVCPLANFNPRQSWDQPRNLQRLQHGLSLSCLSRSGYLLQ